MTTTRRPCRFSCEQLEQRNLLTAIPFGASADDTAEYLLGDVVVSVVLMESDGSIDEDTEQWQPDQIQAVKENIEAGLQWWTDTLAIHSDRHTLNFEIDYTFADQPVSTGYEPISRPSDDFILWIEDFFDASGVASPASFSQDIRHFNHQQRQEHDANWAFTIFVVNSEADPNDRFDLGGSFSRAFAFAGGRFFVMPHSRPASTVAHETGHMFWAFDERAGTAPYSATRGYYGAQNTNGLTGHPSPQDRVASIMDQPSDAFDSHAISPSAREIIGWRDSDGDGIFDVLDVPHTLTGTGTFDEQTRTYHFVGTSSAQTLPNRNPEGTGNDVTINRITKVQYRVDAGPWQDLADYDDYQVQLDVTTPALPADARTLELRTVDDRIGVSSELLQVDVAAAPLGQNPDDPLDVSGDGVVSPLDVLLVIIELNRGGGGGEPDPGQPPYLDVTGDGNVTPRDALIVINHLNRSNIDSSAPSPSLAAHTVAAAFASTEKDNEAVDFWDAEDTGDSASGAFDERLV